MYVMGTRKKQITKPREEWDNPNPEPFLTEEQEKKAIELTDSIVEKRGRAYHYTEEQRKLGLALYAMGHNPRVIGEALGGISRSTIENWIHGPDVCRDSLSAVAEKLKETHANRLRLNAERALNAALSPERLEKASTKDLAVTYGIFTEKQRLIEGESTENINIMHKQIVEYHDKRKANTSEVEQLEQEIRDIEDILLNE
jgi:hypothetical protein